MQHRFPLVKVVLFTFTMLVILFLPFMARAQSSRCFTETGFCIEGVIRAYWEQNGGLAVFGYPTTNLQIETNNDSWTGPTQWFERDRLEDHGSEGVMAGRLGAGLLELQGQLWQTFPTVSNAPQNCRYFAQTRHSMCEPFTSYWEQHGGLERFGYPITEPFHASFNEWSGTVQYFERRRMEHHTDLVGTPYEVLLGLLGNEVRARTGGTPPSGPVSTAIVPYPIASSVPPSSIPTASPSSVTPTVVPSSTATASPTATQAVSSQPDPGVCLTAQDAELARLINAYRSDNGLPAVPVSRSLTHVAQAHVLDLHMNEPDTGTDSRGLTCNMHSWSNKGEWSPVCYTSDHKYAEGMWNKPREITRNIYTGSGYENSYGSSGQADASGALRAWQGSPGHNRVMIELDGWGPWQAMGVAVYEHHAVVWFGKEIDPQGTIAECP